MNRFNELMRRLLSGLTDSELENLVRVREEARHIHAPRRQREARSIPTPRRPVPIPRKMGVKQLIRYFENNPMPYSDRGHSFSQYGLPSRSITCMY